MQNKNNNITYVHKLQTIIAFCSRGVNPKPWSQSNKIIWDLGEGWSGEEVGVVVVLELLDLLLLLTLQGRHWTSVHLLVVACLASLLHDRRQVLAPVQVIVGVRSELAHSAVVQVKVLNDWLLLVHLLLAKQLLSNVLVSLVSRILV